MAIQARNSEMVSLLSADFIQKQDSAYLAGIVAGSILTLPGLVAFWPGGVIVDDSSTWTTSGWGQGLVLANGEVIEWLKGAASISRGMGLAADGAFYVGRSTADDDSAAVSYDIIVDSDGDVKILNKLGVVDSPTYYIDTVVPAGSQSIARFGQSGVGNGFYVSSNGSVISAVADGNLDVTGRIGTAWTALTLNSAGNWVNYGAPYATAAYKKIGDVVMVRGLVARTSGVNTTIATLPAGYRPAAAEMFPQDGDSALARLAVESDGDMVLQNGTAAAFLTINCIFTTS